MLRIPYLLALAAVGCMLGSTATVQAQDYPDRPDQRGRMLSGWRRC